MVYKLFLACDFVAEKLFCKRIIPTYIEVRRTLDQCRLGTSQVPLNFLSGIVSIVQIIMVSVK